MNALMAFSTSRRTSATGFRRSCRLAISDPPNGVTIAAQLGNKPRNCPFQSRWNGAIPRPPVLSVVDDPTSALQARLNIGNGLTVTEMQRYDVAVQPNVATSFGSTM